MEGVVRDRQTDMRYIILSFLAVLVVFSPTGVSCGTETGGGSAEAEGVSGEAVATVGGERSLARSNDSRQEQSVLGALTDVFTTFGDLATALYKVTITTDKNEGRGKMGKMAIPLIIGFKVSGAIVAAIAALKVLVLKTMAMSTLALLASAGVAAKYIYDKMQHGKHDQHQATPYYYAPVQEMAWDTSYDVAAAHTDLSTAQQPLAAAPDLQGHYSNQVLQSVGTGVNQTSYTYIPGAPVAQRKILRGSSPYKTAVYKTVHRITN